MVIRRLAPDIPLAALIFFASGVLRLAQEHAAIVLPLLPSGEADLARLAALCDALTAEDAAWADLTRAWGEALARRDADFASALGFYGQVRGRAQHLYRTFSGGKVLQHLLQACPAPSSLKPEDAPAAMERLLTAAAAHRDLLATMSVDDALLGQIRDARLALLASLAVAADAARKRNEASACRSRGRVSLFEQVRLVEGSLALTHSEDVLVGLESLRVQHLPRYVYGAEAAPVEGDVDSGDPIG